MSGLDYNVKICDCECHKHGHAIRHFMECCDFTYMKYIDENGNIDEFKEGYLKYTGHVPKIKFELNQWYWLIKADY